LPPRHHRRTAIVDRYAYDFRFASNFGHLRPMSAFDEFISALGCNTDVTGENR